MPVLSCGIAFCQQLAFTSRAYIQSPVIIASIEGSKEFGFDSVVLRNDGPAAITAVHLKVTVRGGDSALTADEGEVADERRVEVRLERHDSRKVTVGLGHVEGLKQKARSRKQVASLVILTIESVEFEDGGEWHQTLEKRDIPYDPVRKLK